MSLDFSLVEVKPVHIFERNITHNLNRMAIEAGIYECLWRPEENGFEYAKDITQKLRDGLQKLKDDPQYYEQFNAPNGWGSYEFFVPFVESVLKACEENPEAKIEVSR